MITSKGIAVYERFCGDLETFSRVPSDIDGSEWDEIDHLISSLVLVERGLAAASYAREVADEVKRLAVEPGVADSLLWIARTRARLSPSGRVSNLAAQITSYLAAHPSACDTAQGVRQWLLAGTDATLSEISVALEQLVQLGRVERLSQPSGIVFRATHAG